MVSRNTPDLTPTYVKGGVNIKVDHQLWDESRFPGTESGKRCDGGIGDIFQAAILDSFWGSSLKVSV
jgi:hypothetical protein